MAGPLVVVAGAYFATVNAGSAALFWYDKHQALNVPLHPISSPSPRPYRIRKDGVFLRPLCSFQLSQEVGLGGFGRCKSFITRQWNSLSAPCNNYSPSFFLFLFLIHSSEIYNLCSSTLLSIVSDPPSLLPHSNSYYAAVAANLILTGALLTLSGPI